MSQFRYLDSASLYQLPPEGVITPGQYGDSSHVPRLTINSRGIIVGVELIPFASGGGLGGGTIPGVPDFESADFADADFST